ncbi:MAG: ATP-binding cassette domain-containing protein [Actinobacteria bacterium]|nr:ATP-binding cassette domain-containing protein [Actinomycetota bacterium]
MEPVPWHIVGPLLGLAVVLDALALVDLRRVRAVDRLPRWAWAVVILASFPMGAILYAIVGRQPDGAVEDPTAGERDLGGTPAPSVGAARPGAAPGPPVITTRALTRRFGDTVAVEAVDLVVPRGATYGLIGPNGAGKTTLLSLLTGLRSPSSGEVSIGVGRDRIAVLPDTPSFEPWLTAREVVDLARTLQRPDVDPGRVAATLAEVGLAAVADRRLGGYSRGMLQRLGLATCLVADPEVLLLDEPSSALDPAGRREVLDLIARLGGERTVVLSTHILGDVQRVCDTVGVLQQGRLVHQGPLADLLRRTSSAVQVTVRPPAGDVVAALRASPLVTAVEEHGPGRLVVRVTDAARAETALPRLLADAGAAVLSLAPATDLETAFLELTS